MVLFCRAAKQAAGGIFPDAEPVFDVQQLLGPRDDILSVVARRLGNVLQSHGESRHANRTGPFLPVALVSTGSQPPQAGRRSRDCRRSARRPLLCCLGLRQQGWELPTLRELVTKVGEVAAQALSEQPK